MTEIDLSDASPAIRKLWRQFPREQAREALQRSRSEGVEYGFMWCAWEGGHTGNLYRGSENRVVYKPQVCGHNKAFWHTHPSGSLCMSESDARFLEVGDDFRLMCICNPDTGVTRAYTSKNEYFRIKIKA